MHELQEPPIATIKDAAQPWTGGKSRALQARGVLDSRNGRARRAATVFGWARRTGMLGRHALRTGLTCVDNTAARGQRPPAEQRPQWAEDRRSLAAPHRPVAPKCPSSCCSTRRTAQAMRQALSDTQSGHEGLWPCAHTSGHIRNRLGYRVRRVHKAKPVKRVRAPEALCDHVHREQQASDAREDAVRIAMDTKATLHIGAFSRGGQSRGRAAIQAWDQDRRPKAKLVPWGLLEGLGGLLTILCGTSRDTSALLAAGLPPWWNLSQDPSLPMRHLVIDLANGPQQASVRTQCMQRRGECADRHALAIVWVSYPPYPSKYTPIERGWGILEAHGHGTFLETVDTVWHWARTMTWQAVHPSVP